MCLQLNFIKPTQPTNENQEIDCQRIIMYPVLCPVDVLVHLKAVSLTIFYSYINHWEDKCSRSPGNMDWSLRKMEIFQVGKT